MTNVYLGIVMEIMWSSVRMEGVVVLSSFIASLHHTAQGCRSRHLAAFFLSWRCSRSDGSPRHPLRPRLSCFLFEQYVWQGQTVISRKTSRPDCSLCLLPRWWKFHLWWMMLHTVFKSFQSCLHLLLSVMFYIEPQSFALIVIDISNSFSGKDGWGGIS